MQHIVTGLIDNKFVNNESLLELAYGIVSQSIPALNAEPKQEVKKKELKRPDSFIIPQGTYYDDNIKIFYGLYLYLF